MIVLALVVFGFLLVAYGLLFLGLCSLINRHDERIKAIEQADAEAEQVVDVWYAQSPATVTEKGLES